MAAAQKKRILLVEDDTLLVNMYSDKFTNEGYEVITATDGEDGFKKALNEKYDLLILDLLLPKLSGSEILHRLNEEKKVETVPVLILTNLSQQQEAKNTLSLGAKEYLIKADLTPSQLVDKIKNYLH